MKYKTLQTLGLEPDEVTVYTTLCKYGRLTLAGVAKHSALHRPRLYKLLPVVVKKGVVVEQVIGKRMYYMPIEPRLLHDRLQEYIGAFSEDVDELQGVYEGQQQKPDVTFLLGKQAYNALFDDIADILPKGEVIYRYSARNLNEKHFHTSKKYRDRRSKGHFDRQVITSESRAAQKTKRLDRLVKVIPESVDLFDDNVSQMIYSDRTVMIDHDNESVFIVRSKKIANFQRKLFKLLWKQLPEPKRWRQSED
ncbi:MAG: hypothetical protein KC877_01050 [Candidatus Kaiserbacteria bacterium]|nr:hypothetical protein [Candidatus Kaiserbacteria bacterium]MCB9816490.1 hypothetical protein [Candidatus Nomurabacteria bacterium]